MRRRTFLGLMFLAGCSLEKNASVNPEVRESAYSFLTQDFMRKGLHNLNSPLFDFSNKEVRAAYEKTKNAYGIIERDENGGKYIESSVKEHLEKYGRSLILISGACFHIYGAVRNLREQGVGYVSITPKKLDFYDVVNGDAFHEKIPEEELKKARQVLESQFERINGAVRYYGYENIKDFVRQVSDTGDFENIAVGIEETGLHSLYKEHMGNVYDTIGTFIQKFGPLSVLYLRENMHFYENQRRKEFIARAENLRIPVRFGGF